MIVRFIPALKIPAGNVIQTIPVYRIHTEEMIHERKLMKKIESQ